MHEVLCVPSIASPDAPARYQLRIRAKSNPRPNVPKAKLASQFFWDVLFLGVAELPDFVALYAFAIEVPKRLALILGARFANVGQQLQNRIHRYASHPHDTANGIPFD